ncbi:MAG: hypothetical protein ABIO55_02965 [Ginsengibacter sp.]
MISNVKYILNSLRSNLNIKKEVSLFNDNIKANVLPNETANSIIHDRIIAGQPSFITRFGSSELTTLIYYRFERRKNRNRFQWNQHHKHILCDVSGFFPFTQNSLDNFCDLYFKLIPDIDMLGVWNIGEHKVADLFSQRIQLMNLRAIEPYYVPNPWSSALAGKRVLVIHPFAESILLQYKKRELLFPGTQMLPEFDLQVIPAVQSVADNTQGFNNWFEALDSMFLELSNKQFDVAIIGAGAYGMPLADFIKMKMGKVAIHLGGATQILFGIKGKRWDDHEFISKLFNEYWKYPMPSEIPTNYKKVEDGCYW